jgi:Golgi nucleoside diphosphatase
MNEINFKMSASPARPSSKLRNDVSSMGSGQYKKVLELMLDLEKKVDHKFIESKQQTSQAIMTAYNVDEFRKEMEIMLDDSLNNLENKFQN